MWRGLAYGAPATSSAAIVLPNTCDSSEIPTSTGGKIYKILKFLEQVPNHAAVNMVQIAQGTGIDLSIDDSVEDRLTNNPKIMKSGNLYAYQVLSRI